MPATPPGAPEPALWGDETRRSLQHFAIGAQRMPLAQIHAMAEIKHSAARVHGLAGRLPAALAAAMARAAAEVAAGQHDAQFPLSVWQTGSGTHSHMNLNEVIAARVRQLAPELAPDAHDHVNLGQSSNEVFPSAMHLMALLALRDQLWPAVALLRAALAERAQAWQGVIKLGRTHLQDALPMRLGDEFAAFELQLAHAEARTRQAQPALCRLAMGATALGSGFNSPPGFAAALVADLAQRLGLPLCQAPNLYAAVAGREAVVDLHAALRTLAIVLTKIAGDLRLLGSGPVAGLGELQWPANEPGSSMMPGKTNPSQVEAMTMVCAQVMGHDLAMGLAASQGQLQLNAYQPLMVLNLADSLHLLADAMRSLARYGVAGLTLRPAQLQANLDHALMLATALTPHIGYDRAVQVVAHAQAQQLSLRQAALDLSVAPAADLDRWLDPQHFLPETSP